MFRIFANDVLKSLKKEELCPTVLSAKVVSLRLSTLANRKFYWKDVMDLIRKRSGENTHPFLYNYTTDSSKSNLPPGSLLLESPPTNVKSRL